jgi:hypothetical protein
MLKSMSYRQFGKVVQERNLNQVEAMSFTSDRQYFQEFKTKIGNEPKIDKFRIIWNQEPTELNDYSANLVKIEKVFSDCTTEEIPLPEAPLQ